MISRKTALKKINSFSDATLFDMDNDNNRIALLKSIKRIVDEQIIKIEK